ncbi:MAG: hypothetical protein MK198_02995 [Gracilimonas sp.]|uniref:hypothetical protein n=1 Tax=Gracilimonas sp. TaxID=1974203 RepID=UPI0037538F9E|nr:hypothetical protein [Gracilimonas sp.]
MKQTFLAALLLCVPTVLPAQNYVQLEDSTVNYLQPEDIKPNKQQGSYYNEHWAYHVILENGAEIYVTYSISHFAGVRGAAASGRLSLLNWEGKDYQVAREYDLNDMNFDEQTYQLKLHPDRGLWTEGKINEDHRFYYRTEKDGIHYDISINFNNPFPGFTLGNGVFKLGSQDEVGLFTHIPFSYVSGFVALNGDTVKVKGIGFMDHYYQTNVATRLFETSYKFNNKTQNGFSGGHFMIPKDQKNEVAGYMYSYDGDKLILKNPDKIEVQERTNVMGEKIPTSIIVNYADGSTDHFWFNNVYEKISMLDELSGFKKMIAKRFVGGEILFFRGTALRNDDGEDVYFNLSLVD